MNAGHRLATSLVCLLVLTGAASAQTETPTPPAGGQRAVVPQKANPRPSDQTQLPSPAREPFDGASVEKMAAQCVTLVTASGAIELEMLPEAAPESVRNFLNLAATGLFDTTTFSRVVKDFVIQGGNLSTREKVSLDIARRSRRTIPDEPSYVKHLRGVVSMARPDEPHSATTNFFILLADSAFLDGKFSAFGRVLSGMDVVEAINRAPVNGEKPDKPVPITRATVAPCPAKPAMPDDDKAAPDDN